MSSEGLFSSNSKSFLSISHDNRLTLFSVESGKEKSSFTEPNHLAHGYSCRDWYTNVSDGRELFAVGTSDGKVIIWDFVRGVVSKTISLQESLIPSAISFASDGKSIVVACNENYILQYDVQKGELSSTIKCGKKSINNVYCNPKAKVVAISSSSVVKVVELESNAKKKLEGSFPGGASVLSYSSCGKYLAVVAKKSREVNIFDLEVTSTESTEEDFESIPILQSVPVTGNVISIDIQYRKSSKSLYVACCYDDKDGCIIAAAADKTSITIVPITAKDMISVAFDREILSSKSRSLSEPCVIVAIRDKKVKFLKTGCADSSGSYLDAISFTKSAEQTKISEAEPHTPVPLNEVNVLGALENGGVKVLLNEGEERKRKLSNAEESDPSDKKKKKSKDASLTLDSQLNTEDELTLEQRLRQLSAELDFERGVTDVPSGSVGDLDMSNANSLAVLLEQALQSGDDSLLELCLSRDDMSVIEETARRLPLNRVVLFLRKLVAKFEKRPLRGALLTKWLSSILKFRFSYLITVPDLSGQLAGLSQMLENRLSSYSGLAALAGRLDLLMAQVTSDKDGKVDVSAHTKIFIDK